jgi:hypothetical protein
VRAGLCQEIELRAASQHRSSEDERVSVSDLQKRIFEVDNVKQKFLTLSTMRRTNKLECFSRRHDTQHETQHNNKRRDTQHNDTEYNDTKYNGTQYNDAQHNDTQHNDF